ncbi:hypothetical protein [Krasilnikovia sp. MM14-A1259]|uniref:hypothetical protein n=1 Tax=Krasilnikovia sp. MM14-A1259 TaxID=3373539 RepID=UPI00382392A5
MSGFRRFAVSGLAAALVAAMAPGTVLAAAAGEVPVTAVVTDVVVDSAPGAPPVEEHLTTLTMAGTTVRVDEPALADLPTGTTVSVTVEGARTAAQAVAALSADPTAVVSSQAVAAAVPASIAGAHDTRLVPLTWGTYAGTTRTDWRTQVETAWATWDKLSHSAIRGGSVTVEPVLAIADPGGCNTSQIVTSVRTALGLPATGDLHSHLVMVLPEGNPCDGAGWAGLGSIHGSNVWLPDDLVGDVPSAVLAHEFGHNLGLDHANYPVEQCAYNWVCPQGEYADGGEVMGSTRSPETLNAVHAAQLGLLGDADVSTVGGPGTYTLAPSAAASGRRALKIATSVSSYFLEYRPDDASWYSEHGWRGLLAHTGGEASTLVDTTPGPARNQYDSQPGMPVGGVWRVPYSSLAVRLVSATASAATVQITDSGSDVTPPKPPITPVVSPAPVAGYLGRGDYTLSWSRPVSGEADVAGYRIVARTGEGTDVWITTPTGVTSAKLPSAVFGSTMTDSSAQLNMYAVDAAGNLSEPNPLSLSRDATGPDKPTNVTARQSGLTTTVTWDAATDYRSGVDHYEVKVDGTVAVANVPAGPGPLSVSVPTPLTNATHGFGVTAIDKVGNAGGTTTAGLWTNLSAPPKPIVTAPGITMTSRTATMSWTQASPDLVTGYALKVDGVTVANPGVSARSYPLTLTEGSHKLRLEASNVAGTSVAELTVTVDTTAPTAPTITGPGAAVQLTGTPNLTWTQPNAGRVTGYEVTVDGTAAPAPAAGATIWPLNLADGTHSVKLTAVGPNGRATASTVVVVDTAAPAAPVITGPGLDYVRYSDIFVSWTQPSPHRITKYELSLDGVVIATPSPSSTWRKLDLSDGVHTIALTAIGPNGRATATTTLDVDTAVPEPAVITPLADIQHTRVVTVSWDQPHPLRVEKYDIYVNGNWTDTAAGTARSIPLELPDGENAVTLVASAFNGTSEAQTTVTVDAPPAPEAPELTGPDGGITTRPSTTVTWTQPDGDGPLDEYRVYVDGELAGTLAATERSWTPELADGPHTLAVQANGPGGHTERYVYLHRDTTPPRLATATSYPAVQEVSQTFTLTWPAATDQETGTGLASYTVVVDGRIVAFTTSTATVLSLPLGRHTVEIRATDLAGNVATLLTRVVASVTGPRITGPAMKVTGARKGGYTPVRITASAAPTSSARVVKLVLKAGTKLLYSGPRSSVAVSTKLASRKRTALTVTAYDAAGRVTTRTVTVTA